MTRRSGGKTRWSDLELEALLARGHLSGRQYDEIEARIMARVAVPNGTSASAEQRPRAWARVSSFCYRWLDAAWRKIGVRWWPAVLLAGSAAVASFWFGKPVESSTAVGREHVAANGNHPPAPDPDEFTVKGELRNSGSQPFSGVLDAGCDSFDPHRCKLGDTLMFSANAAVASGYFGAHAERVGDGGAVRIWYFPDEQGNAPLVQPGSHTTVLPRGIRIGAVHGTGRYRITLWLSKAPITKGMENTAEIVARDVLTIEVGP